MAKVLIIAVLIGLISGGVLSWFQFRYIWVNQRRLEEKFTTLEQVARSLALFEREALDPEIQKNKRAYEDGCVRSIELSAETDILMRVVLLKTKAIYSENAYKLLESAFKAKIDIKELNGEGHYNFIERSQKAVEEMNKEIKANISNWFTIIPHCIHNVYNRFKNSNN